jgi:hypothetical protein
VGCGEYRYDRLILTRRLTCCAAGACRVNLQPLWRYFFPASKAIAEFTRSQALKGGIKPRQHLLTAQRYCRVHRLALYSIHPRQTANPALIKLNGTAPISRSSFKVLKLFFEAVQSAMPIYRHVLTVTEACGAAKGGRTNN